MKLLERKEIRQQKELRLDEYVAQASLLVNEITKQERHLNELNVQVLEKKLSATAELEAEIRPLVLERGQLKQEVDSLEERKREALKPIKEQLKAVEVREVAVVGSEAILEAREASLAQREDACGEAMLALVEKEEEVRDRIAQGNKAIQSAQTQLSELAKVYEQTREATDRLKADSDTREQAIERLRIQVESDSALLKAEEERLKELRQVLQREQDKVDSDRAKLANAIKIARTQYGYKG